MIISRNKWYALHATLLVLVALFLLACTDLPVRTVAPPTVQDATPTQVSASATAIPSIAAIATIPAVATGGPAGKQVEPARTATPVVDTIATIIAVDRAPVTAVPGTVSPTPTLQPVAQLRNVFEQVWSTVDRNYLYPDFNGADWDKLKTIYEPKALAAQSAIEYYDLIADMVDKLGDDHSHYESPWDAREEDDLVHGNASYAGIGVLSLYGKNDVTVVYVFPGSPAEKAGLKRRDVITSVDGKPLVDVDKGLNRIRGPIGTDVTLGVTSPGEPPRSITITRQQVTGKIFPSMTRLQADPSIAYLVIPSFDQDDMGDLVQGELAKLLSDGKPIKGIIIDLRGNGGGLLSAMEETLGEFITGKAGSYASRTSMHPLVPPPGPLYGQLKDIPLVILVDKGTVSAAEMFAGAMKGRGRAQIVGITSAGNTETIYPYNLPDGSRLWLAEEGFHMLDGSSLEGKGLVPDFEINVDWNSYSERNDPHILKAIELLQGESKVKR